MGVNDLERLVSNSLTKKAFWAAYREFAIELCEFNDEEVNERNIEEHTQCTWEFEFLKGHMFIDEHGSLQWKDS